MNHDFVTIIIVKPEHCEVWPEPGGGDQLALCGRTAGKGLVCVVRNLEEVISSLWQDRLTAGKGLKSTSKKVSSIDPNPKRQVFGNYLGINKLENIVFVLLREALFTLAAKF